jgi:hypothetical protein
MMTWLGCWLLVEGIMPDLQHLVDVLVEDGVSVVGRKTREK